MAQKNKIEIEYVSRYYSYGSEARKLEPVVKTIVDRLPKIKVETFQKIYIDPAALAGLALAACMLVLMVLGAFHMRDTRMEYDAMKDYVSELRRTHGELSHTYHTSYDLEEIRAQAERIGMEYAEEGERFTVFFSVKEHEEEPTAWEDFVWLISGLLSNPKRPAA